LAEIPRSRQIDRKATYLQFRAERRPLSVVLDFFLFNILDRLPDRRDKCHRIFQITLRQLEFTGKDTIFIHENQPITLFHSDIPPYYG
jgi:hypothetical protein